MKTLTIATASMVLGAVVGVLVCRANARRLRQRIRELRAAAAGGGKPPKMGVMDKVLILEAVILVAYTVADLVIFWHTGSEPMTLTGCVFGVCGLENGVMGWIKTNKDKTPPDTSSGPEPERMEPPDVGL